MSESRFWHTSCSFSPFIITHFMLINACLRRPLVLGAVLLTALKSQDMYLAGTIVLVQAILVVVGTLLSDIALAWLDPRIRFSERS